MEGEQGVQIVTTVAVQGFLLFADFCHEFVNVTNNLLLYTSLLSGACFLCGLILNLS